MTQLSVWLSSWATGCLAASCSYPRASKMELTMWSTRAVSCCFSPRSSLVSTSNTRGDEYPEQRFMSIEADDLNQYQA